LSEAARDLLSWKSAPFHQSLAEKKIGIARPVADPTAPLAVAEAPMHNRLLPREGIMGNESTASHGREQRVEEVLATYLEAARTGQAPDRRELLARHPDLAAELEEFFADHDLVRDLAEPFRLDTAATSTPSPAAADTATLPADSLPARFGDYELLEEVARGGMGIVYRARQISLNRVVALKMILPGGRSPEEIDRFLHTEATAVASLDHPNVVPIYEAGTRDDRPFFSMKLIEGGNLAQHLPRLQNDPRLVARVMATAARAVHHAHQRGLLHRDLKPSNVLLDKDDQPHVTDFGLAKRVAGDSAQTQAGAIVGTPSYVAPEQAAAAPVLTTAVDVYGLGAILYELLTGRPPFKAETPLDTLIQVRTQEPARPSALNPKVDRDLETICLKCLAKEPAQRYGSAEALADDLERWLNGEPIRARPATLRELAVKWVKRRPALAALSGAAVLLVAAVLALSLWGWGQATRAERAAKGKADAEETARQAADDKAAAEKERANEAARRANYIDAHLALEKGTNWIERGDIPRGLLWLVRGLEVAPADAVELQHSLRTLLDSWGRRLPQIRMTFPHYPPRYLGVSAMALSPDGKVLVTAGELTAQPWETATGKPLGPPLWHGEQDVAVAVSPDGKTVVIVGEQSGALRWEVGESKQVDKPFRHWVEVQKIGQVGKPFLQHWPRGDRVFDVVFSPDGKLLATAHSKSAQLWDLASGKPVGQPLQHPDHVFSVAFSPDSKTVATGCADGHARLWEVASGKVRGKPLAHHLSSGVRQASSVSQVLFSPDGRTLLTRESPDGLLWFWDVDRGSSTREHWGVDGLTCRFTGAAFSRDGKFVLTVEADSGLVRIWDLATNRPVGSPVRHPEVETVAFRPDGQGFLTAGGLAPVLLWGLEEKKPVEHLPITFGSSVGFYTKGKVVLGLSPDGKVVLTSNPQDPNTKELWGVAGGKLLHRFAHKEKEGVDHVTFSPDGKAVATVTHKDVYCWDVATGKPLGQPIRVAEADVLVGVDQVALSPGGQTVFTVSQLMGGNPPSMKLVLYRHQLWDVRTGKALGEPISTEAITTAVTFSPDGKTLVLASEAKGNLPREVQVREATTGKPLRSLLERERLAAPLTGLVFSPDGKKLLMLSVGDRSADEARLLDVAAGKFLGEPMQLPTRSRRLEAQYWPVAAFSPDGRTIAFASEAPPYAAKKSRGCAHLWDAATGKPLGDLISNTPVAAVAFSSDGGTLVTASPDATGVNVWKAPSPLPGDVERIRLWVEVLTGLELDAGLGVVELDAKTRRERWDRLQKLGGPPVP
jgi:WD40 repeat protein